VFTNEYGLPQGVMNSISRTNKDNLSEPVLTTVIGKRE